MSSLTKTSLWSDTKRIPEVLSANLDRGDSLVHTLSQIGVDGAGRIVVTGNGASYYAAQTMAVAASLGGRTGPEVFAAPAEWLVSPHFTWRADDRLIVVSTSGELKEAIVAMDSTPAPTMAITQDATSSVGVRADACIELVMHSQVAFTHTQAFAGNVAILLGIWAHLVGDEILQEGLESLSGILDETIPRADAWMQSLDLVLPEASGGIVGGPCGTEPAAYETALLLKELALLPTEAMNVREAATTGLYAAGRGDLCVVIPTGDPAVLDETEALANSVGSFTLRLPGADQADVRLSSITTLPYSIALASSLGLKRGVNVDHPPWIDRYLAATRDQDRR
jgi:fructoselysine-6-P-deglycase FrlB-like protein